MTHAHFQATGLNAQGHALHVMPLLPSIGAQAAAADRSRSLDPALCHALRANDVMRLSASAELGGLDGSTWQIGHELRAVAAQCTSTAWCLWNHLCTYHHFVGLLGPAHIDFLRDIMMRREWVCFPAGASTQITARSNGSDLALTGVAAFGSGARYADWAGVVFLPEGTRALAFSMADLRHTSVHIEPTWEAMSVRASSTDHVHYAQTPVASTRVVPWAPRHRDALRDPALKIIAPRYREDWVALSVLWLGAMATGVAAAACEETVTGIRDRVAILGTRMADRPTIHVNLGRVDALINAASDTVFAALAETDARVAVGRLPAEADYFRQTLAGMQAVHLCEEAMRLLLRVLGGNGLREGTDFERRYRDFQAMPLHINGHIDRVTEQAGRLLLGLETQNPI
jgi:alkylation response protein AidB-like acyl-CoA dehydrogenase